MSRQGYVERLRQRKVDLQILSVNRIRREYLNWYRDQTLHTIPLAPVEDDPFLAHITLLGPAGSLYAGGTFTIEVKLPKDYPLHAPTLTFLTKVRTWICWVSLTGTDNSPEC